MADGFVRNEEAMAKLSIHADAGPQSGNGSESMDLKLWQLLPYHLLLDDVLAFLPFWSNFCLRSVCKKWNHHLQSTNFLDRCSISREVVFIMFADLLSLKAVAAYNPALDKWHLVPLSLFNPPNFSLILASAGGLLCLEANRELFVSNPMNRSYKKLPPMLPMKCPYVVGMMMEADKRGYRILVAHDGESLASQYYDSRSDSWKMNSTLNRRVALISGTISSEGFFFCLTFGPIGLIAYNIEEASWHELQVKMPSAIVSPHVVEYNRRLVLVGGVEEFGSLTSIKLWQLNLLGKECTEVESMPDHLFHQLTFSGREHFFCVGREGLLCFHDGAAPHILMHDMSDKRWWWSTSCALHNSSKSHNTYAFKTLGFSFEPRFDVRA